MTLPNDDLKWHLRFLGLAQLVSEWSKDPSTRVGAVIARPDRTVLSLGYNGFPRGCDDDMGLYEDREVKYERIVHAEMNAILSAATRPEGCTLYVYAEAAQGATCARCAAAVIQSGIKTVVYRHNPGGAFNERWAPSLAHAQQMYMEAGIAVIPINVVG